MVQLQWGVPKQLDFVIIQQTYRNWVKNIPNYKIDNPRKHAQRRIIIATVQLKLRHNYHNAPSDRPKYNRTSAGRCGGILPNTDIRNLENWNIEAPKDNIEQFWENLNSGIVKRPITNTQNPKPIKYMMVKYWLTYETEERN